MVQAKTKQRQAQANAYVPPNFFTQLLSEEEEFFPGNATTNQHVIPPKDNIVHNPYATEETANADINPPAQPTNPLNETIDLETATTNLESNTNTANSTPPGTQVTEPSKDVNPSFPHPSTWYYSSSK